ncbi:MAG: hypothetical protein JW795_09305 [Chitinivibrionales bacterium]|nr:hypothetical protein [Chitinivibrionales bacterium]
MNRSGASLAAVAAVLLLFSLALPKSVQAQNVITLKSPPNGATVRLPVRLEWNDFATIVFRVYIYSNNQEIHKSPDFNSDVLAYDVPPSVFQAGKTFQWNVVRIDKNGTIQNASARWQLTIAGADTLPGTIQLKSPTTNASVPVPVQLAWNKFFSSTYRVALFFNNQQIHTSPHLDSNTFQYVVPSIVVETGKTYQWQVGRVAQNDSCTNISQRWQFTVQDTSLHPPQLVLPGNNDQNQPLSLTLKWNAVSGATAYTVMVATDSSFTANAIMINQQISSTEYHLNNLLPKVMYFWRANAIINNAATAWSVPWRFTTGSDTLAGPVLAFPANAAICQGTSLSLGWKKLAPQATYNLQVAFSPDFNQNTLLINQNKIIDTLYAINGLSPRTYYWRTNAAIDSQTTRWSEIWSFNVMNSVDISAGQQLKTARERFAVLPSVVSPGIKSIRFIASLPESSIGYVQIVDAAGCCVFQQSLQPVKSSISTTLCGLWNLQTYSGRKASAGMYIAVVRAYYNNSNSGTARNTFTATRIIRIE